MKYLGICLIVAGVLMLLALYFFHFTFVSQLLYTAFFIIIIGVVLHVWMLKRESAY